MRTLRKTRDSIWMGIKPPRLAEDILWIHATLTSTFVRLKV